MIYVGDSKACRIFDDRVYRRATLLTGAAAWCQIQSAASEYEMEEEEFHQLQLQQWSKFYSCCVQYYQVKGGGGARRGGVGGQGRGAGRGVQYYQVTLGAIGGLGDV